MDGATGDTIPLEEEPCPDLRTRGFMRTFVSGLILGVFGTLIVTPVVLEFGWVPVVATSDPPRWETFFGRRALDSAIARQAPKLQNPVPPTTDNLRLGLKLYRDGCSGCRGDGSNSSRWGMTGFYPRVPQFDAQLPLKPEWQLFWIVKHGVRYTGMGAWESLMSDDKIWTVVGFLSHLNNLPSEVATEWRNSSR
jgi:mono/diheme cytochrome c family protein